MLVAWNYETSFAPESTGSSSLFFMLIHWKSTQAQADKAE